MLTFFKELYKLTKERINIIKSSSKQRRSAEIKLSFFLVKDLFVLKFLKNSQLLLLVFIILLIFLLQGFVVDLLTFRQIDNSLKAHQSAKAEKQIKQRLTFIKNNPSLLLRLSYAYFQLGKYQESFDLIYKLKLIDSKDIEKRDELLEIYAKNYPLDDKRDLIEILKLSTPKCIECQKSLIKFSTKLGKNALKEQDLKSAQNYLAQAQEYSNRLENSSSQPNKRKRELASIYNLQAEDLLKKSYKLKGTSQAVKLREQALEISVKSLDLIPEGSIYLKTARLYKLKSKTTLNDYYNSLKAYKEAYLLGVPEARSEYNKTRIKLAALLNKSIKSSDRRKDILEEYPKL